MSNILLDFQESLARLERYAAGISDDEMIELQKNIAYEARDSENIKISVEQMKELGKTAIATDDAFETVTQAFQKFTDDYGSEFPRTMDFLKQWLEHHRTWTVLLEKSWAFAYATTIEYLVYDELCLSFIQKMESNEQMELAIERLMILIENKPIEIPMDYADDFKELGERIKYFREEFDRYLKDQDKRLTDRVIELQDKLRVAEATARQCDEIIRKTSQYVQFIPIIGFFAKKITQAAMPETVERRNKAQADANEYKRQIEQANNAQVGLANIQTQFAALDSEFQIICGALAIFANTWAYYHAEALKFANTLQALDDVKDLPSIFKSTVDLSRAVAQPLIEGLAAYAVQSRSARGINSTESDENIMSSISELRSRLDQII